MSMDFIYDEEAVIQEADIFVAEATARGNYLARLSDRGICIHDGVVGVSATGEIFYPEQVGLVGDQCKCWDCGRVFENAREWLDAVRDL